MCYLLSLCSINGLFRWRQRRTLWPCQLSSLLASLILNSSRKHKKDQNLYLWEIFCQNKCKIFCFQNKLFGPKIIIGNNNCSYIMVICKFSPKPLLILLNFRMKYMEPIVTTSVRLCSHDIVLKRGMYVVCVSQTFWEYWVSLTIIGLLALAERPGDSSLSVRLLFR